MQTTGGKGRNTYSQTVVSCLHCGLAENEDRTDFISGKKPDANYQNIKYLSLSLTTCKVNLSRINQIFIEQGVNFIY